MLSSYISQLKTSLLTLTYSVICYPLFWALNTCTMLLPAKLARLQMRPLSKASFSRWASFRSISARNTSSWIRWSTTPRRTALHRKQAKKANSSVKLLCFFSTALITSFESPCDSSGAIWEQLYLNGNSDLFGWRLHVGKGRHLVGKSHNKYFGGKKKDNSGRGFFWNLKQTRQTQNKTETISILRDA